ncbi:MAG: hypothetical protein K0S49_1294, partial [Microbacterium sp.]|nr:hypothetical protein [Microbacterium sp.]
LQRIGLGNPWSQHSSDAMMGERPVP